MEGMNESMIESIENATMMLRRSLRAASARVCYRRHATTNTSCSSSYVMRLHHLSRPSLLLSDNVSHDFFAGRNHHGVVKKQEPHHCPLMAGILVRQQPENTTRNSGSVSIRCFHTTTTPHMAVRQRRRKREPAGILERGKTGVPGTMPINANDNNDDEQASANEGRSTMTTEEFRLQSFHLISRLHAALVPLGRINPDMILSRGRNEVHDNEQEDDREEGGGDGDQPPANPSVGEYLWIDLGPVHGQYTIQADETLQIVILLSPISGQRVYRYNNTSSSSNQQQGETTTPQLADATAHDPNRWMCTDDGHVLEGLLVRDLIRQIQGVPNL
jgi:hypothetical protein